MANKKIHLLFEERFFIEKILSINGNLSFISQVLKRSLSTISLEVKNNGGRSSYNARLAEEKSNLAQYKKKEAYNKIIQNKQLRKFVDRKTKRNVSPEAISSLLKMRSDIPYASAKSIRKYLKTNHINSI